MEIFYFACVDKGEDSLSIERNTTPFSWAARSDANMV